MLGKKSFQEKVEEAGKVFIETTEMLKGIQSEIADQMEKNRAQAEKLTCENRELEKLHAKAGRQIAEVGKLVR